jgi:hypothetical protein
MEGNNCFVMPLLLSYEVFALFMIFVLVLYCFHLSPKLICFCQCVSAFSIFSLCHVMS